MRLLLDENISRYICERLIVDGHDVVRCQDVDAGKADTEVLAFATVNNLTVLTEDTDFGELAMRQHLQSGGVILLRLSGMARAAQPDYVAHTVSAHVQAITLPPAEAAAWAAKGAALIELERYEDALDVFDHAITVDPDDPELWITKGYVFNLMNRDEEALTAFERAAILDLNNADTWTRIAGVLSRLSRYEEALTTYERAIALDPTSAFAWYGKGFMLRRLGRTSQAAVAHEQARALSI